MLQGQAIITGVRQNPPLPTARSPRHWWISSPKNSEDHPDHNDNGEDTDTPYLKLFNTLNILNI
jgi:hypothetical protein